MLWWNTAKLYKKESTQERERKRNKGQGPKSRQANSPKEARHHQEMEPLGTKALHQVFVTRPPDTTPNFSSYQSTHMRSVGTCNFKTTGNWQLGFWSENNPLSPPSMLTHKRSCRMCCLPLLGHQGFAYLYPPSKQLTLTPHVPSLDVFCCFVFGLFLKISLLSHFWTFIYPPTEIS
jgi:hypothetical protein